MLAGSSDVLDRRSLIILMSGSDARFHSFLLLAPGLICALRLRPDPNEFLARRGQEFAAQWQRKFP